MRHLERSKLLYSFPRSTNCQPPCGSTTGRHDLDSMTTARRIRRCDDHTERPPASRSTSPTTRQPWPAWSASSKPGLTRRAGSRSRTTALRVVPRRQVRHLHPLGRVPRAGLRQRVVPPQHVPEGRQPSSSTTSRPTARRPSSATRTSSRSSRRRSSTPDAWAELFKEPARSSSCRSPSTTTASPCTTATFPSGARRRWGRSAT